MKKSNRVRERDKVKKEKKRTDRRKKPELTGKKDRRTDKQINCTYKKDYFLHWEKSQRPEKRFFRFFFIPSLITPTCFTRIVFD